MKFQTFTIEEKEKVHVLCSASICSFESFLKYEMSTKTHLYNQGAVISLCLMDVNIPLQSRIC